MQFHYNYQFFYDHTSKNSVFELLTNLGLTHLIVIDEENQENYAEFYSNNLVNLPFEDKSFRYRIFDIKNDKYIKIEKFFYN